jgi:hypothetical protein
MRWIHVTGFLACLALGACDLVGPGGAEVESVRVVASGPLVLKLQVSLSRPGRVSVTYESALSQPLLVESDQRVGEHEVLLTRLLPGTPYHYTVRAGGGTWSDSLVSGPLPPDVEAILIEGSTGLDDALILYEVNEPQGFAGALIADHLGRVVWYFRTSGALTGSTVRGNGNFVFVDLQEGLVEVTPEGEVVERLPQAPERRIHHDVLETADGTLLFLATDAREVGGVTIVGEAIWAWRPGGDAEMKWSAFDHLSPSLDWGPRSRTTDWLHANSLSLGPRGNHVVSLNFLNQIISVAPDFSAVEWRLGGVNATITADADAAFSGQHTAVELPNGHVLMFDNGFERSEPYSRALELRIGGGEAAVHRDLRPNPANWSRAISSAFRTPQGLTYVTYGLPQGLAGSTGPIELFVVGPADETLGSHRFSGQLRSVYRGSPLETIGGERPAR